LPLVDDNGLALDTITPGLQATADALKRDAAFVDRVARLGERYLADGSTLVHGDYFPGSWVRTRGGVAVIDPEFCFIGAAEFDAGTMVAHLTISGASSDQIRAAERATIDDGVDRGLARQFAGVEIMRRLIGVAQLPLRASLEGKRALLAQAKEMVLGA
jgi:5-methylthioribose kinase